MASQKYANLAQSTLSSNYTAGDGTIALQPADGSLFPSSGDFIVAIDDPPVFFLKCTARSSDTLTVSATGQEGTTAVNRPIGTKVTQVLTAGAFDNIRSDISKIDVYANLPVTAKLGDRYSTTDGVYDFVYNGSNWVPIERCGPQLVVPSGSWSWMNQGSSTVALAAGALSFGWATVGVADNTRAYVQTKPGSTWTCIIRVRNRSYPVGICHTDGTKLTTYFMSAAKLFGFNWNTTTSFNGRVFSDLVMLDDQPNDFWMKLQDNGSNEILSISYDGFTWFQVNSRATGAFLTTSSIGISPGDLNGTTGTWPAALISSFSLTTP